MKYEIIKGSEEDFEGAPEWARLVVEHCEFKYNTWFYESDKAGGKWKQCKGQLCGVIERNGIGNWLNIIAERRPITEALIEFDNDGFPLPGIECEAKYRDADNAEWVAFRCVGVDCGVAFGWAGKEAATLGKGSYEFRPIPSPEDVARDEAIDAIYKANGIRARDGGRQSAIDVYDAIAAGKIPGIAKTPTVSELMRVTEKATREDCEEIVKLLGGVK